MMRKINYLELCQFVSAKQDFSIRWCDRYYRLSRLYRGKSQLIREQLYALWLEEDRPLGDRLEDQLELVQQKLEHCWRMHSVLIRYGQYFGNLPFRVLRNQPIPDCYWYVPETTPMR